MREFKFRVWDENNDEMVHEAGITPEGIPYTIPDNAEVFDQFNYYPACHKMQYTGLKNCDTREEMYEGDVVKGHWWENGKAHRHIGVITYITNSFVVRGVKQYRGYDDYVLNSTYQIIGNIYENPELLTDEEDK